MLHSVVVSFIVFFFFKQKTAYEMRISDWSSDVCSSDLEPLGGALRLIAMGEKVFPSQIADSLLDPAWRTSLSSWCTGGEGHNLSAREIEILRCQIGRASCRERVCQYV